MKSGYSGSTGVFSAQGPRSLAPLSPVGAASASGRSSLRRAGALGWGAESGPQPPSPGLCGPHSSRPRTWLHSSMNLTSDGPACSELENHSVLGCGVGRTYSSDGFRFLAIYLRTCGFLIQWTFVSAAQRCSGLRGRSPNLHLGVTSWLWFSAHPLARRGWGVDSGSCDRGKATYPVCGAAPHQVAWLRGHSLV